MPSSIHLLALTGFFLSTYGLYVEQKVTRDKHYKAVCDLSDRMSCTKAFGSREGHLLGFSNAIVGLIFYATVFGLATYDQSSTVFILAILSAMGSVYLAYISYVKMRNFCLVCTLIYGVNFLLLFASIFV